MSVSKMLTFNLRSTPRVRACGLPHLSRPSASLGYTYRGLVHAIDCLGGVVIGGYCLFELQNEISMTFTVNLAP